LSGYYKLCDGANVKIYVNLVSYNGMSGHPALSYVGDLLLGLRAPSFGAAVTEIEAFAHLDDDGPPLSTLGDLQARFRLRLTTLPQAWFRRTKKRFELAYHSHLGNSGELMRIKGRPAMLEDIPLVRAAISELLAALAAVQTCIRATDEFNLPAFMGFLNGQGTDIQTASDEVLLGRLLRSQETERQRVAAQRLVA
jgi:hypothetical protein